MPSDILIEDFSHPAHKWKAKNDPVMGGASRGTVSIQDGLGIFDGTVVNVPFLQSPGFITMETRGGVYPDVSSCQGIKLTMHSKYPYDGYRLSFGTVHVPGGRFAYGYKSNFQAPLDGLADVYLPFSSFTAKWDDATGNPIVTCQDDPQYCPTVESLQNLQNVIIWAEGVNAEKIHLEIASIHGAYCTETSSSSLTTQTEGNKQMNIVSEEADIVPLANDGMLQPPAEQGDSINSRGLALACPGGLIIIVSVSLLALFTTKFLRYKQRHSQYTTVEDRSIETN